MNEKNDSKNPKKSIFTESDNIVQDLTGMEEGNSQASDSFASNRFEEDISFNSTSIIDKKTADDNTEGSIFRENSMVLNPVVMDEKNDDISLDPEIVDDLVKTIEEVNEEDKRQKDEEAVKEGRKAKPQSTEKKYEQVYNEFLGYEQALHVQNQKRIKIGLWLILLIPLVFLTLLFVTDSSKIIFLVLWIVSLFLIAGYLILVEYADYKIQTKLNEIGQQIDADTIQPETLIGDKPIVEKQKGMVFRVFLADFKRIRTNVVAVVILIGLCILPCLYAWFNILSNWDPYGPSATGNLKVAVYSSDEGIEEMGIYVNVGDKVVEGLKENDSIGWVFTESEEEALEGVDSGDYYAAMIMPEDFSKSMVSFLSAEYVHPTIQYYENEKKNAIAPKITGKAKTAVQEEVNSAFLETVTQISMKASNTFVGFGEKVSLIEWMTDTFQTMDNELLVFISAMNSFVNVTNAVDSVLTTSISMVPDVESVAQSGQSAINAMQGVAGAGGSTSESLSSMMNYSFDVIRDSLNQLDQVVNDGITYIDGKQAVVNNRIEIAKAILPYMNQMYEGTAADLKTQVNAIKDENLTVPGVTNEDMDNFLTQLDAMGASMDALTKDMQALTENALDGAQDIKAVSDKVSGEIANCRNQLDAVQNTFETQVRPSINDTMNNVSNVLQSAQNTLGTLDGDFSGVTDMLTRFQEVVQTGNRSLMDSVNMAKDLEEGISAILEKLKILEEDPDVKELEKMLLTNPEQLASFVASPVAIKTEEIYPVKNYGSAMAPFYTILALWVGALCLVAIIHVKVEPEPGLEGVTSAQAFFGRYLTFFILGQIQALITVLGDLEFIGIQCVHPGYFWFASAMCSFVFTMIMYALTVALGNIGEALAVVIMVVQVAGAGGTFPLEVLPQVYQNIAKFLPFTYGMNAMKEAVCGLYENFFWECIGKLSIFALVSLVVGLVVAIPFRKMNEKIEESKEESEIML